MSITQILEYKGRDTVAALTDLLSRAHRGQIRGLVFAYQSAPHRHRYGVTGEYWADPGSALGCTVRLSFRLNQIVEARDANVGDTTTGEP